MLDLRSNMRQKLLGYYCTNPSASHYLRELAALLEVDPANLLRELSRLERQGLFVSTKPRQGDTIYIPCPTLSPKTS